MVRNMASDDGDMRRDDEEALEKSVNRMQQLQYAKLEKAQFHLAQAAACLSVGGGPVGAHHSTEAGSRSSRRVPAPLMRIKYTRNSRSS